MRKGAEDGKGVEGGWNLVCLTEAHIRLPYR